MSSNASSSGIESDADSSPSLHEEKDNQSISDINNSLDESINTLIDDNDDEGFINMDYVNNQSYLMLENMKQSNKNLNHEQIKSTTSKSIHNKPSHYPYSTRNPYDDDDDTTASSVVEDWDEECKMSEPYYFPGYIRRAQWPNHWRWTPPLGIRRTCTQQLHRNLGFEPSSIYDDINNLSLNINFRHFTFDF